MLASKLHFNKEEVARAGLLHDFFLSNDDRTSKEKFLYIHGFMGTGKRQFINYICEFLDKDVIKLEYYCKAATVCDDILLSFNSFIDNNDGYSSNA